MARPRSDPDSTWPIAASRETGSLHWVGADRTAAAYASASTPETPPPAPAGAVNSRLANVALVPGAVGSVTSTVPVAGGREPFEPGPAASLSAAVNGPTANVPPASNDSPTCGAVPGIRTVALAGRADTGCWAAGSSGIAPQVRTDSMTMPALPHRRRPARSPARAESFITAPPIAAHSERCRQQERPPRAGCHRTEALTYSGNTSARRWSEPQELRRLQASMRWRNHNPGLLRTRRVMRIHSN
ncbi:hypothetical protein GA0111570_105296 [Raineyella antarctica]|uniref:Uncharacterized protein n=1 Tax=Raineyella antarctica TaxID=1577474 RepID=A0A1G6GYZ2_9ACTN|nr:hypothetical protein GA0111570_105296 [Raineyella antarctica]